jgi:hypothetical protein
MFSPHWLAVCPDRILRLVLADFGSGVSSFFSRTPEMEMSEVNGRDGTVGVV